MDTQTDPITITEQNSAYVVQFAAPKLLDEVVIARTAARPATTVRLARSLIGSSPLIARGGGNGLSALTLMSHVRRIGILPPPKKTVHTLANRPPR